MIVSIRGIERGKIFRSDYDRRNFLNHLGKLIPDRYKSILCQEDPYLKELVRYIQNVRLCLEVGNIQDRKNTRLRIGINTFY